MEQNRSPQLTHTHLNEDKFNQTQINPSPHSHINNQLPRPKPNVDSNQLKEVISNKIKELDEKHNLDIKNLNNELLNIINQLSEDYAVTKETIVDLTEKVLLLIKNVQPKLYLSLYVFTRNEDITYDSRIVSMITNIYNNYYGLVDGQDIKISYPFLIYGYRVDSHIADKNNNMTATIKNYEDNIYYIEGHDEKNNYYINVDSTNNAVSYYYEPKVYVDDQILKFN